ncbi:MULTISPECIES: glycoside hydrolase family 3 N-terminal domain-containing protein [unclassified Sphingopyxis]|jgi:beta-glucosidase|uniref:glycoside hydrolase family 3 protein n=1 Tax=unclassified Sphingopyxis TaxID=2614943 RepID=UPI00286783FD|nr:MULTISPECIES: glycoside hydrolase family 3 N-terminal domain-containing protein [unclassified Sphingopyxis]MDR6832600.1 beta-glucosidase [Sphingopyxis sp. BE122]MDR7228343.1 beta-glucosidase [Sphingopyxis sp. BE259]
MNPVTLLLSIAGSLLGAVPASEAVQQPEIGSRAKGVVVADGLRFHDLDGNGALTPYEDWRLPAERRAQDLIGRMTLEEKAGLLLHGTPPTGDGGLRSTWDIAKLAPVVEDRKIRFFIHRVSGDPSELARKANAAQELGERSRLGIPLVISSDPRNHVVSSFGLTVDAGRGALWPEPTGLAAIGDASLVKRFAETTAAEYRAMGIRMALSPMADLASEPRWPRVNGTFGDDPAKVAALVGAYVEGMQGGSGGVGTTSVATVVKHWVGYGAAEKGYDGHNPYGQRLIFPTGDLEPHVVPFRAAFRARAAGVMPTYGIFSPAVKIAGRPAEQVAGGFNKGLLTDLLRKENSFDGIVLTDWKITDDCPKECQEGTLDHEKVGMPWGVEHLSKPERFAKALDAGVDQFGGVMDLDILVGLVRDGRVPESRIDLSAQRLLALMFRLGIFENAYVDADRAAMLVGNPEVRALGADAQRRSLTLLKNGGNLLPLRDGQPKKVWLWKLSETAARAAGFEPVADPADADIAILRLATPYTQRSNFFFGSRHHEGSTAFVEGNADLAALQRAAAAGKPVITSVYLDRPAILGPVLRQSDALFGDYGIEDSALFDVISGKAKPEGKLPFELPSTERAVERQRPDLPSDSKKPQFRSGFGLRYR